MGSKIEAKKLMAAAGVPVLADSPDDADRGRPAAAGEGVGRRRRARHARRPRPGDLLDAEIAAARAEAASAFGDGTVFVEPYVEAGRHVEVQVLADAHGTVVALGERDCSIQRRHQKVVEEAPAPGLPDDPRTRLHEAAARPPGDRLPRRRHRRVPLRRRRPTASSSSR